MQTRRPRGQLRAWTHHQAKPWAAGGDFFIFPAMTCARTDTPRSERNTYSPSCLAMMIFMISFVPAYIR